MMVLGDYDTKHDTAEFVHGEMLTRFVTVRDFEGGQRDGQKLLAEGFGCLEMWGLRQKNARMLAEETGGRMAIGYCVSDPDMEEKLAEFSDNRKSPAEFRNWESDMKRTSWRNTAFSRAPVVRIYNEYPDQITQPVKIALVTDLHSTRYGCPAGGADHALEKRPGPDPFGRRHRRRPGSFGWNPGVSGRDWGLTSPAASTSPATTSSAPATWTQSRKCSPPRRHRALRGTRTVNLYADSSLKSAAWTIHGFRAQPLRPPDSPAVGAPAGRLPRRAGWGALLHPAHPPPGADPLLPGERLRPGGGRPRPRRAGADSGLGRGLLAPHQGLFPRYAGRPLPAGPGHYDRQPRPVLKPPAPDFLIRRS